MSIGIGNSPKTNFGGQMQNVSAWKGMGSPSNDKKVSTVGTVIDIRLPGERRPMGGDGLLAKVIFDSSEIQGEYWVRLKNSYEEVLATIGNREAVIKNKARVLYTFHPTSLMSGEGELICDNKQEFAYSDFQKNPNIGFISAVSSLSKGSKAY